jgi:predicted SAM-dependent methyltransferase
VSETRKWRHLTAPYCQGAGVDLGSGGDPVVPTAISVDLPPEEFNAYLAVDFQRGPMHLRGDARKLHWFADGVLDYVYSSHLLEDFPLEEWSAILREWCRVVRPGGYLVLLLPERERFRAAVAAGQPDNVAHRHEPVAGELSRLFTGMPGWAVLEDRLADERDYSLIFIATATA